MESTDGWKWQAGALDACVCTAWDRDWTSDRLLRDMGWDMGWDKGHGTWGHGTVLQGARAFDERQDRRRPTGDPSRRFNSRWPLPSASARCPPCLARPLPLPLRLPLLARARTRYTLHATRCASGVRFWRCCVEPVCSAWTQRNTTQRVLGGAAGVTGRRVHAAELHHHCQYTAVARRRPMAARQLLTGLHTARGLF